MNNIYYSPESFGLTIVGTAYQANLDYEFSLFVVWKDKSGRLYWGDDQGCSCPSPFEDVESADELVQGSAHDAINDLKLWADGGRRRSESAHRLADTLVSLGEGKSRLVLDGKVEWGVFYENGDGGIYDYTEPINGENAEQMARQLVSESSYDRGLRRRFVTEWEEVDG